MRIPILSFVLFVAVGSPTWGQNRGATELSFGVPRFEVASIKANTSPGGFSWRILPGGRFVARNVPLPILITRAYGIAADHLQQVPGWAWSSRFDVDAVAADRDSAPKQIEQALQALLTERFSLVVDRRTTGARAYALTLSRNAHGPNLRRTQRGCSDAEPCRLNIQKARVAGEGQPIAALASTIAVITSTLVIDRTGLAGLYDFTLDWSVDQSQASPAILGGDDTSIEAVFRAVEDQLGLRLTPETTTKEVIVIKHVERPTPN
jgi:uncharacterized protein (TIGR03435 family)